MTLYKIRSLDIKYVDVASNSVCSCMMEHVEMTPFSALYSPVNCSECSVNIYEAFWSDLSPPH